MRLAVKGSTKGSEVGNAFLILNDYFSINECRTAAELSHVSITGWYLSLQSKPLRVKARTSLPAMRIKVRKPSCLIS
jgi:hypothetical protein